jgi:hypothetical protein
MVSCFSLNVARSLTDSKNSRSHEVTPYCDATPEISSWIRSTRLTRIHFASPIARMRAAALRRLCRTMSVGDMIIAATVAAASSSAAAREACHASTRVPSLRRGLQYRYESYCNSGTC